MYNNETNGNSSSFTNIRDTATALKRDMMSTAFWALAPGSQNADGIRRTGF